jgi:ATP-dependent exoDNAse (exonuclease V) beta subunit
LYLASAVKEGKLSAGTGSLASVLPASVQGLFVQAPAGGETVAWTSRAGAVHTFRVCRVDPDGAAAEPAAKVAVAASTATAGDAGPSLPVVPTSATTGPDDLQPVEAAPGPVSSTAVAALAVGTSPHRRSAPGPGGESDRVVGVLVHRLLQHLGMDEVDAGRLRAEAARLLADDEAAEVEDRAAWIARAVDGYLAISRRPEVRALLGGAETYYEVPFSMLDAGRASAPGSSVEVQVVRGTIDCLARHVDGALTVLEFKTGRPRPEHEAQAELYRRAAEAVFPGAVVTALVVYAGPMAQ